MYLKSNSKLGKIIVLILNGFSIVFKTISFLYLKIKSTKQITYKKVFIISIDNLSFGGTGKTPLVIQIGKQLLKNNINFAIVTRGYKSKYEKKGVQATPDNTVADIGDEAALLKKMFPGQDIFVGKNRHRSIQKSINRQNKIILLDDGFQSTDIFRNLKIMLINPHHPYYYLRNFRFMAREEDILLTHDPGWSPPDIELKNKTTDVSNVKTWNGVYGFNLGKFYNQIGKEVIPGNSPIVGFSAVGDNSRFRNDLSKFNLIDFRGFRDHFNFTANHIAELNIIRQQKQAQYLVCTEKDFMRIFSLLSPDIPLIYVKNCIQYNIDIINIILTHAKKSSFI
jgi:tetraacyldisaccharide 4'-kinase